MVNFRNALEQARVTRAVTEGFPLAREMMLERFKSMSDPDVQRFHVALRHVDGTRFTIDFAIADITLAQAYDPEYIFVGYARQRIVFYLDERREGAFHNRVHAWHFEAAGESEPDFKEYMEFTDEEYDYWKTTGKMPEGWKQWQNQS